MNIPKTIINLEALLYALSQQTEPLPESLQQKLREIGQELGQNESEAPRKLRQLITEYPPLESAYKQALQTWDKEYTSQQRAKNISIVFPNTQDDLEQLIDTVISSLDWVTTVQQLTRSPKNYAKFWDKSDRLVVMIAGGAALGSAIAQLPGAIVGAILAAGYGCYINFRQTKSVRNS
jgi:hypothetical protein